MEYCTKFSKIWKAGFTSSLEILLDHKQHCDHCVVPVKNIKYYFKLDIPKIFLYWNCVGCKYRESNIQNLWSESESYSFCNPHSKLLNSFWEPSAAGQRKREMLGKFQLPDLAHSNHHLALSSHSQRIQRSGRVGISRMPLRLREKALPTIKNGISACWQKHLAKHVAYSNAYLKYVDHQRIYTCQRCMQL